MLSLPDFKEKQVLFVQTERGIDNTLKFCNDNIVFKKDGKIINRASCHRVFSVFVVGDITVTSYLMQKARDYGISFFFLKHNLETYSSILAQAEGNYLLREKQYSMTTEKELTIAKKIVENKIHNQIRLLNSKKRIKDIHVAKRESSEKVMNTENAQSLLGIEGNATKEFFPVYFEEIGWYRRLPRVKPDECNVLMDMGYSMLHNIVDSLLRLYGFDTFKGCYHRLFFQRRSLACDIMEPFRCIIDRKILTMFNLGQVDKKDFKVIKGAYSLSYKASPKYNRLLLETIMEYKEDIYGYIKGFYRYVMDDSVNPFPSFKIKR
ncbi:MAG: type V CRISPR-associated endonuclease Cas1 [bacterium]